MLDKLQEILGRTLNGFETDRLLKWIKDKTYTEEEILNAYEYCEVKQINYITKYLENNKQKLNVKPEWFDKEIEDEPLEPKELLEFQKEMKEFYKSEEEWKKKTQELLNESKTHYN